MRLKYSILLTFIFISGCSLFFTPDEISISKIETYEQLTDATAGAYGQLSNTINKFYFNYINFTSDDLYSGGNSSPYPSYYGGKCWNESEDYNNIYLRSLSDSVYISLYKVVASINNVFFQFNIESEGNKDFREILGELYYLRAYCYFRLVRLYGQIPVIDNADVCYMVEKPTFAEIYEFIENDLNQAIKHLPCNRGNCHIEYETPHRGTAKALLAEVYLSWAGYPCKDFSKYELAAGTALEVIDSAGFYGFELESDFINLWDKNGKYNNESVFSLFYDRLVTNSWYYTYRYVYRGTYSTTNNSLNFTADNIYFLSVCYYSEVNFYNSYPRGYRRDITFFNNIYVPDEGYVHNNQLDTGYIYIDQVDPCSRVAYRKFYLDTLLLPLKSSNHYNFYGNPRIYLFRYAQTLLTYAEAAARSGNLNDKAYQCVNMVRRRANYVDINTPSDYDLQPGLSAEAFADSVFAERGWELAGEHEGRWFDLLRMERIDEVLNSTSAIENNFFYEQNILVNYFLPIPESDIELSPNWED